MISTQYTFGQLCKLLERFEIQGEVKAIVPLGNGHINDTYHAKNMEAPDYVLQRINHQVFRNVPALMANIESVTSHLRKKLACVPGAEAEKEVLTLLKTREGRSFLHDGEGNFWRTYYYLENTRSYEQVSTAKQAFEGGKAYGRFQMLLADLNVNQLVEVIPDFHNIERRLEQLAYAIALNPSKRVKDVSREIDFVLRRETEMSTIVRWGREGKLPQRITHNDTKFNNVLLDANDTAQCVIDLDTVMPGYVAYDFGDAVRTIINPAREDEADLEKIVLNLPLFESFTKGFLQETITSLSALEIDSLGKGVLLLPYIMGVRFLTDYINGDIYYKTDFDNHNLQRARAQFRLVSELERQYTTLTNIINATAESVERPSATI